MKKIFVLSKIFILNKGVNIYLYVFIFLLSTSVIKAESGTYDGFKTDYDKAYQLELSHTPLNRYYRLTDVSVSEDNMVDIKFKNSILRYLGAYLYKVDLSNKFRINYGIGAGAEMGVDNRHIPLHLKGKEYYDLTQESSYSASILMSFGWRLKGKVIEVVPKIQSGLCGYLIAINSSSAELDYGILDVSIPISAGIDIFRIFRTQYVYLGFGIGFDFIFLTGSYKDDSKNPDSTLVRELLSDLIKNINPSAGLKADIKIGFNYNI